MVASWQIEIPFYRCVGRQRGRGFGALAQVMDTSRYQVSDLDGFELYSDNDQLYVDAVFIPSIDTPFSPTAFDQLEMGGSTESSILLDGEEEKKNSPPTTLVSERPTQPPVLKRSYPFGSRKKNVSGYDYRTLFK